MDKQSSNTLSRIMTYAEKECQARSLRFTPVRRRVLEMLVKHKHPVSAYQLLDELVEEGHKPAPPTIYRALDFLLEQGFIHRLATQNNFVACTHLGTLHMGVFLVCKRCKKTVELLGDSIRETLVDQADQNEFSLEEALVEVNCLCQPCQSQQERDQP